jgi:hypothetical protein
MEVQALSKVFIFDVDNSVSCVMLQDELFEEEEGSLVLDFLSYLNLTLPQMGSVRLFALITLKVHHHVFNHERLLKVGSVENLFLTCYLYLKSLGM